MARPEKDQEQQPESLPINPPRLGKEAKIGVVVILLGLVGLGVAGVLRFTQSTTEEPAASADALFGDLKNKTSPTEPPQTLTEDRKTSESNLANTPDLGVPPLTPPKTAVRSRYADIPEAPPAPQPPVTTPVEEQQTPHIEHNAPLPGLVESPPAAPERKRSRYERSAPSAPSTPPATTVSRFDDRQNNSRYDTPSVPSAPPPTTGSRFGDAKENSRYDTPSVPSTPPATTVPPFDDRQNTNRVETPPVVPSYRPGRVYTVKPGETLFDIARLQLGKATRWIEIYELNRSILGKELEALQPGMKLTLPESSDSNTTFNPSGDSYHK